MSCDNLSLSLKGVSLKQSSPIGQFYTWVAPYVTSCYMSIAVERGARLDPKVYWKVILKSQTCLYFLAIQTSLRRRAWLSQPCLYIPLFVFM